MYLLEGTTSKCSLFQSHKCKSFVKSNKNISLVTCNFVLHQGGIILTSLWASRKAVIKSVGLSDSFSSSRQHASHRSLGANFFLVRDQALMRNSSHALLREGESRRELFKNSTCPRIIQAASQSLRKDSFLLISPTKMPSHARSAKGPLANRLVVICAATSDSNSSKALKVGGFLRGKNNICVRREIRCRRVCPTCGLRQGWIAGSDYSKS